MYIIIMKRILSTHHQLDCVRDLWNRAAFPHSQNDAQIKPAAYTIIMPYENNNSGTLMDGRRWQIANSIVPGLRVSIQPHS